MYTGAKSPGALSASNYLRSRLTRPIVASMVDLRPRLQAALGPAYQVQKELGGGGMSRVFVAHEVRFDRSVVVKVLPPEFCAAVNVERFEREIALAARLQHPHIVSLLTAGASDGLLYYIMPHITGQSLRARLVQERELPVGETVRILRDICDALAYAHAQGIVHRDIKPDNVLLSGKHALVTDFGVAKAVQQSSGAATALTSMGVALGTPAYMAPEQAAGDPTTDHRADLYALGVLAYETLTGRTPFTGPSVQAMIAQQVTSQADPVTKYRDTVPPALDALVMRCLAKHPADRWQSANEVLEQLEQMMTTTGSSTPTAATPSDTSAAAAAQLARPLRVAGLFVLTAAAVLGAVYVIRQLLGLPDWVLPGAAVLLAAGLPIMVVTALFERRRAFAHSTGRAPLTTSGGWHGLLTWRKATTGGLLAFAGLGLGTAVYMLMRTLGIGPVGTLRASGVLGERDRIVLADFDNRTRDSTLGPSVGAAFQVDLAQSPAIKLLDDAAITTALQRMQRPPGTRLDLPLARELAQREGAKAVVHGEINPVGRGYVVAAELVSAADGSVLVALRENAQDDGAIIEAVDRLSKRLRERIGESLTTIRASPPLERVTTGSLEALQRYSQATRAIDRGDDDRAIALLQDAIALDTSFAMAYRKLAVVLNNTGGAASRLNAAATSAFRHRDRLPPRERYLATAFYYESVDLDRGKTEDAYRAALELGDDEIAGNNLALLYNDERRFAEAESVARPYVYGAGFPIYYNMERAQIAQGKFAAAGDVIRLFEQNSPGNPMITMLRSDILSNQGLYDSAEALVRRNATSTRSLGQQAGNALGLFSLAAVRGHVATAEKEGLRFMDLSERRQLPSAYLSGAVQLARLQLRFKGGAPAARATVEAALAKHPLATMTPEDRPYATLAWLYAEAGQPDRARRLLAEYEATRPEGLRRGEAIRIGAAATASFAEGKLEDAIRGYRAMYDEASCTTCGLYELARSYDRAGHSDSAIAVYERAVNTPAFGRVFSDALDLGPAYRRLAELYEARGTVAKAREYYGKLIDLWKTADPSLQRDVSDVRGRLAKLSTEGP